MGYICDIPKKFCNVRDENGECRLTSKCEPIVDQCNGCKKIENGFCKLYMFPRAKWTLSKECPAATHLEIESKTQGKRRVGQQKQSKRRRR